MTIRRTAERPRVSIGEHGPHRVFAYLWQHRSLIYRLTRREVEGRYRGSLLGLAWSFITPVLMIVVFTFVFSIVFKVRWDVEIGGKSEFALILFAGLVVFQFFADCIGRAPGLMLENVSYIKKVVFPLEALGWVAVGGALFNVMVNLAVLLVAHVVLIGVPPWTVILVPLVFLPFAIMLVGGVWLLAALGVYVRDLRQVIGVLVTLLMFVSPIFYPVSALPEALRAYMYLNPLAYIIEQTRVVLLYGGLPDLAGLGFYALAGWAVAWVGYVWFTLTKRGFADVV